MRNLYYIRRREGRQMHMHQDLLLQLFYHFLSLLFLVSGASILSKSCNLTVIKQSYWIIVVSQN
ncbi:hypothetical protein V1524DRAFT_444068, partial [Lipomyces starkeyi]